MAVAEYAVLRRTPICQFSISTPAPIRCHFPLLSQGYVPVSIGQVQPVALARGLRERTRVNPDHEIACPVRKIPAERFPGARVSGERLVGDLRLSCRCEVILQFQEMPFVEMPAQYSDD